MARKRKSTRALTPRRFALAFRVLFPPQKARSSNLPRAVVACSGGLDSMVLVDLLRRHYEGKHALARLEVCHFDHGQRPAAETARDHAVVRDYCARHKLALTAERLPLQPGASEAEMRRARLKALAAASEQAIVFTAHHADDQLETFFLRVLRGTHPDAFTGIAARARLTLGQRTLRFARPLLGFTKLELHAYARAEGLEWSEDASNTSKRFARNRIRHELVPLVERLRPGGAGKFLRFFEEAARKLKARRPPRARAKKLAEHLRSSHGYSVLATRFPELQTAVHALLDEQASRTTRGQWESLKRQLTTRQTTRHGGGPVKTIQFPGGHALAFRGNRLFWIKNS